jgi:radical SAM superfamily enzyme YgiQ (UPF0313 family)
MKIALVQCPVWGTREPPLALAQLSACLKSAGHEVRSYDINHMLYRTRNEQFANLWAWEQSLFWYDADSVTHFFDTIAGILEGYADSIVSGEPVMVGFSLAASTYPASVAFARILKRKNPGLLVVFGGQLFHDSRAVERAFREAPVDYVVVGEGDVTVPEIATVLENHGDISHCAGVYFGRYGEPQFAGPRQKLPNLDGLPYMDFSDLRIEDYDDVEHLPIMSSRGCVWSCRFCSSCAFWGKYREMNAERMHQEITFHKLTHPLVGHIDFQDLAFNANIQRVREFCDLMIKYPPFGSRVVWLANAIVNPHMTRDDLSLMKEAGCKKLIFGIESGSQRVLDLMGKRYRIGDAKRIIRDTAEAGIAVTTNFMFGFPGETENDFQLTLDFVTDVGRYIERVYPSRTYCALEEFSRLGDHPEEFGVRTPVSHHLYWETLDGANTYPIRLKRCQQFEQLCNERGVKVDCGVKTDVQMDEWFNLGHYHEYRREYDKAAEYFLKYYRVDPKNKIVSDRLRAIAALAADTIPAEIDAGLGYNRDKA